jgi:Zn-dependent peptidase ImmA (M78 family)
MLELQTSYTFTQVPYLTYDALEEYAEALVRDAMPERLNVPGPIDVEAFVEFYLGLSVEFRRICYDKQVLGMTAFNDGVVQVMDEEKGVPEPMPVKAGTVIIDSSLSAKRNLARLRFTAMHEGAHWLLHRKAFAADNPFGAVGVYENQYLAAKAGRIDYSRSQKERTDSERMERQADFLASAVLMPRPALREAFRDFFRSCEVKPRRIVRGRSALDDCCAAQLPEYIAGVFSVSGRAALIRLEKLTAIVNRGWPVFALPGNIDNINYPQSARESADAGSRARRRRF